MESTFIEGVKHANPIVRAIAVKALHYQDLATMSQDIISAYEFRIAKHKYDVLVELWNELSDGS